QTRAFRCRLVACGSRLDEPADDGDVPLKERLPVTGPGPGRDLAFGECLKRLQARAIHSHHEAAVGKLDGDQLRRLHRGSGGGSRRTYTPENDFTTQGA